MHLTTDSSARVRVCALDTLTACLCMVQGLPRNDANIFPEYVLPSIAPLATDTAVVVRIAYARNVATLAKTAVRFLDQTQLNSPPELPGMRYESELNALHEMLHQTVSHLLTDTQPIVKQTLMECGITKLCVFFGRQKANDLILSHMITFLNDKEDQSLRGSFFDCIVGVAAFVGWQCSDILIPLLQQGLTDTEEFVVSKSIRATTALTELGLIQKTALAEFISDCACYLNHPNLWIRHEIAGLIAVAAGTFGAIDVQCKIMPAISGHLKCSLIQVEKPEILLDCLQTPIPRTIFDSVVRFGEIDQLFRVLQERKDARASVKDGILPQYGEMSLSVRNVRNNIFFATSINTCKQFESIFTDSSFVAFHRTASTKRLRHKFYRWNPTCWSWTNTCRSQCRTIKSNKMAEFLLTTNRRFARNIWCWTRTARQSIGEHLGDSVNAMKITKYYLLIIPSRLRKSETDSMNSDWHHMYTNLDSATSPSTPMSDFKAAIIAGAHIQDTPSSSLVEYSMPEKNSIQGLWIEWIIFYKVRLLTPLLHSRTIIGLSQRPASPPE